MDTRHHPHAGQPIRRQGPATAQARIAVILVHGRGDSASGILALADTLDLADVTWLAPQASGHTWYPYSFLAPMERNQPGIDSGLLVLEGLVAMLDAEGIDSSRLAVMGFSQGACLAQEFAARHARRYHAVIGLSGGLIGPPGTPRNYAGAFDATPVFLGCSDVDFHIPAVRVSETAAVLRRMGANVTMKLYPGMGHLVNEDEIAHVNAMMQEVAGSTG